MLFKLVLGGLYTQIVLVVTVSGFRTAVTNTRSKASPMANLIGINDFYTLSKAIKCNYAFPRQLN